MNGAEDGDVHVHGEGCEEGHDGRGGRCVEPGRWLIEEEDGGTLSHCHREGQPALLPTRESRRFRVLAPDEAHRLEKEGHLQLHVFAAVQLYSHGDMLASRQEGPQAVGLAHVSAVFLPRDNVHDVDVMFAIFTCLEVAALSGHEVAGLPRTTLRPEDCH